MAYHTAYDLNWHKGQGFAQILNAEVWAKERERTPETRRHLVAWAKPPVGLTAEDKLVPSPELVKMITFTGTSAELNARLGDLKTRGATEVIYQPTGSDISGELRRFAAMAGL